MATLLATACAVVPPAPPATVGASSAPMRPPLGLFSKIRAPEGHEPFLQLAGRGAMVFRCESHEREWLWVFRQPEADLRGSDGRVVARHGAGFSFEHVDGSRLVGTIAAYDDPPSRADLRWLLFTTRSYGRGALTPVTHVQRINTAGGMPPEHCEASQRNQLLRVDFSADFLFYRAR